MCLAVFRPLYRTLPGATSSRTGSLILQQAKQQVRPLMVDAIEDTGIRLPFTSSCIPNLHSLRCLGCVRKLMEEVEVGSDRDVLGQPA